MNEVIDEGYILNTKTYKEADAMMWVYLKDSGLKHFIYKGYFKPGSKRLASGLSFHLYQFKFKDKVSLITPIEIVTKKAYHQLTQNMQVVALSQIINSIYLQFHQHLSYSLYQWTIEAFNDFDNERLVLCLFLVDCLNQMGLQPFVDGDVKTNQSQVNHFDIKAGGMIYRPIKSIYNVEELRLIRQLFKAKPSNYSIISNAHIDLRIVGLIVDYFEYHTSFHLNGYHFYLDLL